MNIEKLIADSDDMDEDELTELICKIERISDAILKVLYGKLQTVRNRRADNHRELIDGVCGMHQYKSDIGRN